MWDVIIIGGGHAGCEAVAAAARVGCQSLLLTQDTSKIGEMSCNPAIGGIGKGHLVREIDALDGVMARVADKSAIQYRLLNKSKGAAVQGPRSQSDRDLYKRAMQETLNNYENVTIASGSVTGFRFSKSGDITHVVCANGEEIAGRSFILTSGTFLNGRIYIGDEVIEGGRMGDASSYGLSEILQERGFSFSRLKTGTPPRLHKDSIDFSCLQEQFADSDPEYFSHLTDRVEVGQISCFVTETNAVTHNIIRDNLHLSAMYSGAIGSVGPRYCPSIEDKVVRFEDKSSHRIFLEPEGLSSSVIYPNGISTSLPRLVQESYVRSIDGLGSAEILQPGYAIEYDYVDVRQLRKSLQSSLVSNLFMAGQINGTTGYEEAAAQGLMAGVNAAKYVRDAEFFILDRSEAYIGVMLDDLTSLGVSEPYRMFTSRAEYRLRLRSDNADMRLTDLGVGAGIVGSERSVLFAEKCRKFESLRLDVKRLRVNPLDLDNLSDNLSDYSPRLLRQLYYDSVYAGYIKRQQADIDLYRSESRVMIPDDLDFASVGSLSTEVIEKLREHRPRDFAAAARISGVTPASLVALMRHLR